MGANGQGKSTLVKLMLGDLTPISGSVQRHAQAKVALFAQDNVERLVIGKGDVSALAHMKELHPDGARPPLCVVLFFFLRMQTGCRRGCTVVG